MSANINHSPTPTPSGVRARMDDFQDEDDDDVDFDAPMSYEDRQLLRQIQEENREDDELANDAKSRGALLSSPLLLLAAAATATNSSRSSVPTSASTMSQHAPVPEIRPAKLTYRSQEKKEEEDQFSNPFDGDMDLDAEPNEDDLQFGSFQRSFRDDEQDLNADPNEHDQAFGADNDLFHVRDEMGIEPNDVDLQFGTRYHDDPQQKLAPNSAFDVKQDLEMTGRGRCFYLLAWIVAAVVVITAIGVLVAKNENKNRSNVPPSPGPLVPTPEISLGPSKTPIPTRIFSSQSPTQSVSTTRPEASPMPISEPTTRLPSIQLTPLPSLSPVALFTISPTSAPLMITPVGTPTQSPTQTPSQWPSPTPSILIIAPSQNPSMSIFAQTQSPSATPTIIPTVSPSSQQPVGDPTQGAPTGLTTGLPTFSVAEEDRRTAITTLISDISGAIVITDPTSPQFMAYNWILNDDQQQLDVKNTTQILQRYALATIYYSTNVQNTWISCGPPDGSTACPTEEQRCLSKFSECQWTGITCEGEIVTGISWRENGLQGKLQRELAELPQLNSLVFSRNQLTGTIATDLGRLSRLRYLLLNRNELGSVIPTLLGKLSDLFYLHLGDNQFTGTLSPELFVPSLQHLDFGGNALLGTIPEALFTNSPNLINLDISNNFMTGTLPSQIDSLTSLSTFTAENNTFTGTLPGSVFSPEFLSILDVGYNKLTGSLPADLFTFGTSLTILNLEENGFTGEVSSLFGQLTKLNQLILLTNDFTGTIPSAIGQLSSLQVFHVGQTKLIGSMPEAVCALRETGLRVLSSDCGGDNPKINCTCCTFCF